MQTEMIATTVNHDPPSVLKELFFFNCQGYLWRLRILLSRITHLSASMEGTTIFTCGRKYETPYQLADLQKYLPPARFYRIHPLHIVALEHVKGIDKKEILVSDCRLFSTNIYRLRLSEALDRKTNGTDFIVEGKLTRILFANITHVGLISGTMMVYTVAGKYRTDYDITEILTLLPEGKFIRISRTFIVAPMHVDSIEDYIVNVGLYRLPITYFYRMKLLAALQHVEPKPIVNITTYKN